MLPAALLSAAKSPPLTLARHRVPREQVFLFCFFFRKRVAREEEGERELPSSRALSPFKNLKKKKKNLEKKNPPPRTGFVIALNSSAFPLGSLKNIVHCSPGCPSNRSRGPSSHRIPAAATLAASSRNSGTESARPKCGTGTGSPSTAEAADLAS